MRTKGALLACLLLALGLAACGTGDRGRGVAAVTERFHAALQRGDGRAACAELSPETASKLEQQEKKPCAKAILGVDLPGSVSVRSTEVYERSAFASLGRAGAEFLDEGPDGWTVSAAGCTPTAPDQPYECELEG